MLTMTEVDDIRTLYFEKGETITEIAKQTGRDRKTIRKSLAKEDFNAPLPRIGRQEQKKLSPYTGTIDRWLEQDRKAKRKQRHTAKRVYERLLEKNGGFPCSYRTVAAYVRKRKAEIYGKPRGYLPLEHQPGEAQVDFGSAEFYENGTLVSGKYLNVSFPYSNAGYLQLFPGGNAECLFEGLKRIFEFLGGVPPRLWFDNPPTVVVSVLKGGGRHLTERFLRFKEHHRFEAAFCNPSAGNEKGNVENKVGYHRRNFLVPIPRFQDLEEYNRKLLSKFLEDQQREHYRFGETIASRHEEDRKALLPLPAVSFDCARYEQCLADAYGKFRLTPQHTYSASPRFARRRILVKITAEQVIPLDENQRPIAVHRRLYGSGKQESMDWIPYLTQLAKSPGALKYTGIWQLLPETLQACLNGLEKPRRREFLKVLAELTERDGFDRAAASLEDAARKGLTDPESLRVLHNYLTQIQTQERMDLSGGVQLPPLPAFVFSAGEYDAMIPKGAAQSC